MFLLTMITFAQNKPIFNQQVTDLTPSGNIRCVSAEYEKYLQSIDPKRMTDAEYEAWLAPLVEKYKNGELSQRSTSGNIITIPVVVHVIYNGEPYGTGTNITDEQVQSQITVMNQDFRKMAGTPGSNTNPVGADTEVQFALAKVDPNGNPTNGIDRVNLCTASWSTTTAESMKAQTYWDPTQYMNMYSCNMSGGILGYAQFPSNSGLSGLSASGGNANTDGVVSGYNYFGTSDLNDGSFTLSAPYDKGRTMTHEVGHFLGLRHIWGDATCGTDYCADTPTAHTSNFSCPTTITNCDSNGFEMVQNYMDYTDDTCMNIYTQNQKDRIRTVMSVATRRASLATSTKDQPIALFNNDAEVKLPNVCTGGSSSGCSASGDSRKIMLYNRGTSTLTSATLQYNINGGTNYTYNWSGSLATNKYAEFDMPITNATTGTLNVTVLSANSITDERSSNNSASTAYTAGSTATPTFDTTTVTFNLQRDKYGSETTWNLKNSAGTTLYSGGPYTDTTALPALLTQTWTLSLNECYTFTINDSYGDGICCTYGSGYYNLKNGATVMTTSQFSGSTESYSFRLQSLGVSDINNADQMFVIYPNPNKGTFFAKFKSDAGKVTTNIFDASGKLIHNDSFNHIGGEITKEFRLNLPKGTYLLSFDTPSGTLTDKLVIK